MKKKRKKNVSVMASPNTRQRNIYVCLVTYLVYSKSKDPLGKVANPARGELNREKEHFPVPVRA